MESIAGISVHGLSVRYETRAEEVVALKHVSVDLHPGEFVAIHGVSGSGKTTLLAVLGGLLRAVDGQVHSFGTELSKIDDNGLAEYRRTIAGTVFQEYNLISSLRAIENVAMPLVLNGMTMAAAKGVARLSLDRLHIADLAARFPGELSGGQRQRLAIARALSADKPLLLVDEPTGALDTATANAVVAELQEVARAGTLVVAATHDPHVRDQADRVLHLVDGQLA